MRSVVEMMHDRERRIRLMRKVAADIGGRAEVHMLTAAWSHAARLINAGRAIVTASQAAASGNVIAGAPRTWAVRWISRSGFAIAYVDRCETTCFVTDERETYDYRRRMVFRCRPCWDATARVWRWGSPAHDPRGCAWPRPWVGGEVR